MSDDENTEKILKSLPPFEVWLEETIKKRKDYGMIKMNCLYYGLIVNLSMYTSAIRQLSEKNNGVFSKDDPEFQGKQNEWLSYYEKIILMRGFITQFFSITPPNVNLEIAPERYTLGILMSEEDFIEFVVGGGRIVQMRKDGVKEYEEDLISQKKDLKQFKEKNREILDESDNDSDDDDESLID